MEKEMGHGPTNCKLCRLRDVSSDESEESSDESEKPLKRHKAWSGVDFDSPVDCFVDWLIKNYTRKYKAVLYTHYGSRFDEHFIMRALCARKIVPILAQNG
jgi:hypothetical protein